MMTYHPNMQSGFRHALAYCATKAGQSLSAPQDDVRHALNDSAYCLDAPEAIPAGSMTRGEYSDSPAQRIAYRT